MRVALAALYCSQYPAIGESHALSVLAGVVQSCVGSSLERLDIVDLVSLSQEDVGPLLGIRCTDPVFLAVVG